MGENGTRIPLQDLPDDIVLALSGMDITEKRYGGTDAEVVETTHKPRFWSKTAATQQLGAYLKMFTTRRTPAPESAPLSDCLN